MNKIRPYSTGASQSEVRAHNERLMLSLLHREGAMAGSDMARHTGLSPQTASVILRKLESDGLIRRGETQKGRVGKPSVPMAINPDGLYSFGIKIGRRSTEVVLMDFTGHMRGERHLTYAYPTPDIVFEFIAASIDALKALLEPLQQTRICGVGIGMPFDLWRWHEQIGAPKASLDAWRSLDCAQEMAQLTDLPVFVINDATAACRAEHLLGRAKSYRDCVYFFVASFMGGGVVLNGSVYEGSRGNAGALGPLPMPLPEGGEGRLLDLASINKLERLLVQAGHDAGALWQHPLDWSRFSDFVTPWLERTAEALAKGALASCAVIDFEAVIIDGAMPEDVRARLVQRVQDIMPGLDDRGLIAPTVEEGTAGQNARALGAAAKPLIALYLLDSHAGFAPAG